MKHDFEPKGRHTQKGMTDKSLVPSPERIDEIIDQDLDFRHDHMHMENGRLVEDIPSSEQPDITQQGFRGTLYQSGVSRLQQEWDTWTREELLRVRNELKDLSQPKHHIKTPLPFPKE